jgi:hypothetical protein
LSWLQELREFIKKPIPVHEQDRYRLVSNILLTVEREPTLSAGYKIPPRQLRLHLLPDLIDLVVGLSKCKGSATEIAQFALGDLTFKSLTHHSIYSSVIVKHTIAEK